MSCFLLLSTVVNETVNLKQSKLEQSRGSNGKLSSLPVTAIHTDSELFSVLVTIVGLPDRFISSYHLWLSLRTFVGQTSSGFLKNSGPFHQLLQFSRSAAAIPLLSISAGFKLVGLYLHCS